MDNPFATRHTRPGAIPFFFPPGDNARQLVDRLRSNDWWGEIVGPHGSGKSTLLRVLIPELNHAGRRAVLIELHDGQRRLGVDLGREAGRENTAIVIVDGYEQLSLVSRMGLKRFCRRRRCGLVVTSHRPCGLPLLYRTAPSPRLAEQIVQYLLRGQPALLDAASLERCFARHEGDLRELLFELYDVYEQRGNDNGRLPAQSGGGPSSNSPA
mgnify:CR=1 FL=1